MSHTLLWNLLGTCNVVKYGARINLVHPSISVLNQAFLDAEDVKNPAMGYGAQGIAGLGFNRLSSIDLVINETQQSTGRSLLFNLFETNPTEPNFIAFALQRNSDKSDEIEGSFSIGEYP